MGYLGPRFIMRVLNWMIIIQFSYSVVYNSLWLHRLQYAKLLCPSPIPRACSKSHVHRVCDAIQPSHPLSSPSSPTFNLSQHQHQHQHFQKSQFFSSGGQSTGVSVSASVLPMNIQDWFPLEWTGWISLQSKGLSRVFSINLLRYNLHKIKCIHFKCQRRHWQPTPVLLPTKPHGWRSLVGCSPWGR